VTEAVRILRSGKRYRGFLSDDSSYVQRYRGFLSDDSSYVPVTMTAYPIDARNVRMRYLFPVSLGERVRRGSIIYLLIEDRGNRIAELRVTKKEGKDILAVLDFVTEDRRKIPRVKVEGILEIEAQVECGERALRGKVVDISLLSLSVRLGQEPPEGLCRITVVYEGLKTTFSAKKLRYSDGIGVFEVKESNGEMVGFLRKVYSGIFLKVQRSS